MAARRIEILDTTLRDGAQGEGVAFSVNDKLKIIRALDGLGVDYIEAGNPAASPRDRELFDFAKGNLALESACLVAFGATRRARVRAEDDPGLRALVDSGAPVASLFGKASAFHVRSVLQIGLDENLEMIYDTVKFLTGHGLRVFFDAEHFFDGFAEDGPYALGALKAAVDGGAELLALCDTNGGSLPAFAAEVVARVGEQFKLPLAIHCHNDAGLATAVSMSAVEAGASQVQGALNGYGERCGNANLCEIAPNLALKMGLDCLKPGSLRLLSPAARLVAEIANVALPERCPYVGRAAFAHKGGMHIDGMLKDERTFEHIDPALVGNERRFLISEMSGRGAVLARLRALDGRLTKDSPETGRVVQTLKALEAGGYSFEDADGSLELRLLGELGRRRVFFEVLDFHVFSRKPEDERNAQAYVKVRVGGDVEITADEGDGPVNALDCAVRKALSRFYPCLARLKLMDFKVRVISASGTASRVRVHMDSSSGRARFGTVGVSSNIIEASFIALTDAIEYMLMNEAGA